MMESHSKIQHLLGQQTANPYQLSTTGESQCNSEVRNKLCHTLRRTQWLPPNHRMNHMSLWDSYASGGSPNIYNSMLVTASCFFLNNTQHAQVGDLHRDHSREEGGVFSSTVVPIWIRFPPPWLPFCHKQKKLPLVLTRAFFWGK